MRQSVAPNRASSTSSNSAAIHKLMEKKKEFEGIAALDRAAELYKERVEALAEDCDIMAIAGEMHGQVLGQWPKMFQILNLFLSNREESADGEPSAEEGQVLVRVPIEDLQQSDPPQ
ncbi:hypothetical protein C8J56DRAFT_927289 [Mycena floridula]|nr:hypothetical protein C8J56DRAFT_927289 [Mycena floridula]